MITVVVDFIELRDRVHGDDGVVTRILILSSALFLVVAHGNNKFTEWFEKENRFNVCNWAEKAQTKKEVWSTKVPGSFI